MIIINFRAKEEIETYFLLQRYRDYGALTYRCDALDLVGVRWFLSKSDRVAITASDITRLRNYKVISSLSEKSRFIWDICGPIQLVIGVSGKYYQGEYIWGNLYDLIHKEDPKSSLEEIRVMSDFSKMEKTYVSVPLRCVSLFHDEHFKIRSFMNIGNKYDNTEHVICKHLDLNSNELQWLDDYAYIASRLTFSLFGMSQDIFTKSIEAIFDGEEIEL